MKISSRFIMERVVRMIALAEIATIAAADRLDLPLSDTLTLTGSASVIGFFLPMFFECRWARKGVLPTEWILEQLQPVYFVVLNAAFLMLLCAQYGNGDASVPWALFLFSLLVLYVARTRVAQGMSIWGDVVHEGARDYRRRADPWSL